MGELLPDQMTFLMELVESYGLGLKAKLSATDLQMIHADLRSGGISMPQVVQSLKYVCLNEYCEMTELLDVFKEMDRRYFLMQHLRWEYSMLDSSSTDTITEEHAKWFVQMVHAEFFCKSKWENFLRLRPVPGSGVTFAELEVMLCNIPSLTDLLEEEENERKEERERLKKMLELESAVNKEKEKRRIQKDLERKRQEEEERQRKLEEERRLREENEERLRRQREKSDAEERRRRLEEEEKKGLQEAEQRGREEMRAQEDEQYKKEAAALKEAEERKKHEEEQLRQQELQEAADYERLYQEAKKEEIEAEEEADRFKEKAKLAEDERLKLDADQGEKRARLRWRDARNRRIRYNLKVSIKKRDEQRLPIAVEDFKKAQLPDDDMDLAKAEKILREWQALYGLKGAMRKRKLLELEKAIHFVKRNGFEFLLSRELIEANKIILQLRRLERIRAEILELKQSTVAEIRSYQKPPIVVHQVMTGTFVLLGHKEKQMKDWKTVQSLVGKTGRDGLKRRCLELDPGDIPVPVANHAKSLLSDFDLDDVRDVSAGAATFYAWSWTMIEELEARIEIQKQEKEELEAKQKAQKEADSLAEKKSDPTQDGENQ